MNLEQKVMKGIADFVVKRYRLIPVIAIVLFVLSLVSAQNIQMLGLFVHQTLEYFFAIF